MYKIIGGNQKEYGPISADDVRRWILEGRLHDQTLAWVEGSAEWKPLASFPEFAEPLRMRFGQGFPSLPAPGNQQAWTAQVLASRPELRIGECLTRSWDLLKANLGLLFGATFVIWLVESVCQRLPIVNMFYWVIQGVVNAGLYLIFLKRIRGQPASIGEVFAGFSSSFPQLLLAGMITTLISVLGWAFCILPGVYLTVAWIFSVPLVADKRLEFWSAMELSRKVVTRVWFEILGLVLLAFLPMIIINLFAIVKVSIVVIPAIFDLMNAGKFDPGGISSLMVEVAKTAFPLWVLTRFALLLNLPFALGALMYGYESLFGSRESRAA